VDVILDHFLAKDDAAFGEEGLMSFTQQVYDTLDRYEQHLPTRFQTIFPYMKRDNWLYHYKSLEGISRSLNGLVRRAAYLQDHQPAVTILQAHYRFLESCYKDFIPDVKDFAKSQLELRSL
jgi:acyl carrier protein phosphodiesterase